MRTPILAIVTSVTLFAQIASAAHEGWVTDFEKAKQEAAASKKDILIDFTGSDWCGWCIRLQKEVFSEAAFKDSAPKNFVLFEADFPQKTQLSPELQKQNDALQKQFNVKGFPTILLLDSAGRPYAQTGYQKGGADAYLAHLETLRATRVKRDEAFAKAETQNGVEKAASLKAGIEAIPLPFVISSYGEVLDQIKALDPEDTLGTVAKLGFIRDISVFEKTCADKKDTSIATLKAAATEFIAAHPKATAEQKQQTYLMTLNFLRKPFDFDGIQQMLNEVKALAPDSRESKGADAALQRLEKIKEAVQKEEASKSSDKS